MCFKKKKLMFVTDIQADRLTQILLLQFTSLGTLTRRSNHLSYPGSPKNPPPANFVLTYSEPFDLGAPLRQITDGCLYKNGSLKNRGTISVIYELRFRYDCFG